VFCKNTCEANWVERKKERKEGKIGTRNKRQKNVLFCTLIKKYFGQWAV
jgi:hypothetical protein